MSINRRKKAARANRGTGWSINWTRERSYVVGDARSGGVLSMVPVVCASGRCGHVSHPRSHGWQRLAMVPAGTDVHGAYVATMRVWSLS
jgi:hypothetical protein